jgi:cell division protein FtsL
MTAVAIPARAPSKFRPDRRARQSTRTRPAARRGHLALVDVPGRVQGHRRVLLALGCVAVLALFTVVAFHALLAQSQVAIDRLERQTSTAQRHYEQARYEHASLASPERIVQRAAALGLVPPEGPPTAIPVAGELSAPPEGTASTLHGWTEVKPTLADSP